MQRCFLPTLTNLMAQWEAGSAEAGPQGQQAVAAWSAAVAAVNHLLKDQAKDQAKDQDGRTGHAHLTRHDSPLDLTLTGRPKDRPPKPRSEIEATVRQADLAGLVLSGPLPMLDHAIPAIYTHWLLAPPDATGSPGAHLLPAAGPAADAQPQTLLLLPGDPLAGEKFCLVLTAEFSLIMVLGQDDNQQLRFQFSFAPDTVGAVWLWLRSRIQLTQPTRLETLDQRVQQFAPIEPDYRLVSQFSQQMWANLPLLAPPPAPSVSVPPPSSPVPKADCVLEANPAATSANSDAELLQAMAHEIRTPLSTIRTFTRSLLRRRDLADSAVKRLKQIDRECTQQIDRFNLIFRAVELATAPPRQQSPLAPLSLSQLFDDAIPQWQQQASRHNITLSVGLPPRLPLVVSDPTMLSQVLTGLVERFVQSLPPHSHLELQVMLAGSQLKLQFQAPCQGVGSPLSDAVVDPNSRRPSLRSVGHLLMFQPETGGLSLNLDVTKTLFQALGGKLIVRQRPQQGEVLTVFLPLETYTDPHQDVRWV